MTLYQNHKSHSGTCELEFSIIAPHYFITIQHISRPGSVCELAMCVVVLLEAQVSTVHHHLRFVPLPNLQHGPIRSRFLWKRYKPIRHQHNHKLLELTQWTPKKQKHAHHRCWHWQHPPTRQLLFCWMPWKSRNCRHPLPTQWPSYSTTQVRMKPTLCSHVAGYFHKWTFCPLHLQK